MPLAWLPPAFVPCYHAEKEYSLKKGPTVKTLAVLAIFVLVLLSGTLGSKASSSHRQQAPLRSMSPSQLPAILSSHPLSSFAQSSTTGRVRPMINPAAPTATATKPPAATPTATATATNNYPDPTFVLQNMLAVFDQVRTVHYQNVLDGEQANTIKFNINDVGDATCKGPALKGKLTATQTLEGTSQSSTVNEQYVQIKKKNWVKKAKQKHFNKVKVIQVKIQVFGNYQVQQPLNCTAQPQLRAAQTGTTTIKDLKNEGPDVFNGIPVWRISGVETITIDTQGNTLDIPFYFLISQDHYFPYVYGQSINDTQDHATLNNKQVLTKAGEKVTVKTPRTK